jgi:isoleucyl-tRNA synthetase
LAKYIPAASLRAGLSDKHWQRMENWPRLIALREEVLKALEVARQEKFIGGSLEACVVLVVSGDIQTLVEDYRDFLRYLFIVSKVEITSQAIEGAAPTGIDGLSVKIEKAPGQKCERCWNFSVEVGKDQRYPAVCERCSAAIKEIEESSG